MSTSKNSSTSILTVYDSILQLLHATKEYTLSRIQNKEDRRIYSLAIESCRETIRKFKNEDCDLLIDRLTECKLLGKVIKNPWFGAHTPRQHADLAHDHAIDIVKSLSVRFVTAVSSESRTVHKRADVYGKPKAY